MLCPSLEILAQYHIGQLNPASQQRIAAHLAQPCIRCSRQLSWYKEAELALNTPLQKGPTSLMHKAKELFARSKYALPEVQEYFFAQLMFDSSTQEHRAGTRSVVSTGHRRLLFHTDMHQTPTSSLPPVPAQGFDVDIAIKDINEHSFQLRGQILSQQQIKIDLHIDLYQAGELIHSAHTNQHGEFSFSGLIAGDYQIQIKLGKWVTVVNLPSRMFSQKFS